MRRRNLTLFPIVIALLFAAYQYFGAEKSVNPETGRSARVALSTEQEATLGLQSYREVLSQSKEVRSGPERAMVERIAKRLAAAIGDQAPDFDWQVALIQSDQANAFCLPGGKIAVYTGILPYTQNEDGLAAVMGHEMGHAIARHGSQRMLRTSVTQTLLAGAQFSLTEMDPQQRGLVMAALGVGAQYGVLLPFSREHENEADEMGLMFMARAGYDPREAVRFWERMSSAGDSRQPQFMSTHPAHATRIQHLQSLMPKAEAEFAQSRRVKSE